MKTLSAMTLVLALASAACAGTLSRTGACPVTNVYLSPAGFAALLDCTFPTPANSYVKGVYYPTNWTNPADRALYSTLLVAHQSGGKVNVAFDLDNAEHGVSLKTLYELGIMTHEAHNATWAYRMFDIQLAQ